MTERNFQNLFTYFGCRVAAALAFCGLVTPPDHLNPHPILSAALGVIAGFLWAASDLYLKTVKL